MFTKKHYVSVFWLMLPFRINQVIIKWRNIK